jgi:hypothetical protein
MGNIGKQREIEDALASYSTPFKSIKTSNQNVQFTIEPNKGLTKRRYLWYTNGTRFDGSFFSDAAEGIRLETGSSGTDVARIKSGITGQYVSHSLGVPGMGLNVPEQYVDQSVTIDIYDEPDVDETTFNQDEFKNTRSSVQKDPPYNLYRGVETDVTINDTGRVFIETLASPGSKKDVGVVHDAPGYIIDPGSSAMLKIGLDSNNDTTIAVNSYCHEEVSGPDLTQLDGTN